MIKNVIANIVGIFCAMLVISTVEWLSHLIFPVPSEYNLQIVDSLKQYLATRSAGELLLVPIGWAMGSFIGGLATSLYHPAKKIRNTMIVSCILMTLGIFNMVMIPHPLWFWIIGVLSFIPFGMLGSTIAWKRAQ